MWNMTLFIYKALMTWQDNRRLNTGLSRIPSYVDMLQCYYSTYFNIIASSPHTFEMPVQWFGLFQCKMCWNESEEEISRQSSDKADHNLTVSDTCVMTADKLMTISVTRAWSMIHPLPGPWQQMIRGGEYPAKSCNIVVIVLIISCCNWHLKCYRPIE